MLLAYTAVAIVMKLATMWLRSLLCVPDVSRYLLPKRLKMANAYESSDKLSLSRFSTPSQCYGCTVLLAMMHEADDEAAADDDDADDDNVMSTLVNMF